MNAKLLTLFCLCATVTALFGPGARAQDEEPEYLVEVVVFRHANAFDAGEVWTPSQPLFAPPLMDAADLQEEEPRPPRPIGQFAPIGAEDFQLSDAVAKLSKADAYSVISHTGWRQSALQDEEAAFKSVGGRDAVGRLNGTILLSRNRYLRLDFDLTLTTGAGEYVLQQDRRRVQTGVTHYIDHPHFGLLLLVSRAP